jgi:hypothetical protein
MPNVQNGTDQNDKDALRGVEMAQAGKRFGQTIEFGGSGIHGLSAQAIPSGGPQQTAII